MRVSGASPSFKARVLLVEDNSVNAMVAGTMLKKLGCTVDTAGDGLRAVEAFSGNSYDLVFMDCQMPKMDGFEATAAIREREKSEGRPRVPIIALTGNAVEDVREQCMAAGMDDCLSKPFTFAQVAAALERWAAPAG